MASIKHRVLKFIVSAFALGMIFFALGATYGYVNWIPQIKDSRFQQAVDTGLFALVFSLVIDLPLYFKLMKNDAPGSNGNGSA